MQGTVPARKGTELYESPGSRTTGLPRLRDRLLFDGSRCWILCDPGDAAVRKAFFFDDHFSVDGRRPLLDEIGRPLRPPILDLDGFPSLRLGRAIARVENGIHDVRVIECLHRLTTAVHRIEHVREHVDVSERTRLVAYRKQPSGFDFR